jgi:pimeloyl-ACP methyl ester carboxylesterase
MSNILKQAELAKNARLRAEHREILVGNTKTAFWFYPAENRSGRTQTLVMIHGYRGNHHGLEAIAGGLTELDIYMPDLPGFGQSEPLLSEHSIQHYADWLAGFIKALKLNPLPHLLGHSFGATVVSKYASEHDGIASLILENPVASPALKGSNLLATAFTKTFFWLAGALPQALAISMLKSWPAVRGMSIVTTKSRNRTLRRWIHGQHDENFNDFANLAVALEGYEASVSNCVSDFAPKFKVPVLMLVGERDEITTIAKQKELFQLLPTNDCAYRQFPNVGHLTHYEIPGEIASEIQDWIRIKRD